MYMLGRNRNVRLAVLALAIVTLLLIFKPPKIPNLHPGNLKPRYGETPKKSNGFRYIDPLIGSVNGGHVFPGASLPFGMQIKFHAPQVPPHI